MRPHFKDTRVICLSIQKPKNRNGYKVRFYLNKKQLSVYLPSVTKRQAEDFERFLKQLVAAKETGGIIDSRISQWLSTLPEKTYEKLASKGLAPERAVAVTRMTWADIQRAFNDQFFGKPSTMAQHHQAQRDFTDFVSLNKKGNLSITEFNEGDAKAFASFLNKRSESQRGKPMAVATVRKRCSRVKQVFKWAIENGMLERNPIDAVATASIPNKANDLEVPASLVNDVIAAIDCPDAKMLLALCRFGGFRYNETCINTWEDCIDLESGWMKIKSNKTPPVRDCPIFSDLRPHLEAVPASERTGLLQKRWSVESNQRTQLAKMIKRAGFEPWPKLIQNLRANRATGLVGQNAFPPQDVAQWLGHDIKVLYQHYAMSLSRNATAAMNFSAT